MGNIIDPDTGNPIGGIQGPVEEGQPVDTRQGHLFVWVETDGSTNGADGLTAVQGEPPTGPQR